MIAGSVRNTGRNVLRPGYLRALGDKAVTRVAERGRQGDAAEAAAWAAQHAESSADFATAVDADLWAEAESFAAELHRRAMAVLAPLRELGIKLGGGGDYALLYFLSRALRPSTVVETGVAAGFSTQAVLAALHANQAGRLLSSDFPYFRLDRPEQYVGILVEDGVKDRWSLYLRGDRANLPEILHSCPFIDLLHYDSDKSYRGRRFAMEQLGPHLGVDSHVVMDDIQDNTFFKDLVERRGVPFRVFAFGGKHLGLMGPLAAP